MSTLKELHKEHKAEQVLFRETDSKGNVTKTILYKKALRVVMDENDKPVLNEDGTPFKKLSDYGEPNYKIKKGDTFFVTNKDIEGWKEIKL